MIHALLVGVGLFAAWFAIMCVASFVRSGRYHEKP